MPINLFIYYELLRNANLNNVHCDLKNIRFKYRGERIFNNLNENNIKWKRNQSVTRESVKRECCQHYHYSLKKNGKKEGISKYAKWNRWTAQVKLGLKIYKPKIKFTVNSKHEYPDSLLLKLIRMWWKKARVLWNNNIKGAKIEGFIKKAGYLISKIRVQEEDHKTVHTERSLPNLLPLLPPLEKKTTQRRIKNKDNEG